MKVLFYTRNNLTDWSSFLSNHLSTPTEILTVSEINGIGDYSLQDEFYNAMSSSYSKNFAIDRFGLAACEDMIARCRLLKNIDEKIALKMIGSMTMSIEKLLDNFQPQFFLSLRVDSYVLDIFSKILEERKIKYLGLWKAALLEEHFFFTTSGEHVTYETIDEKKVEGVYESITSNSFKATSIVSTNRFSLMTFAGKWIYYLARDFLLTIYSKLVSDAYGYRYMTTGRNVPEYNVKLSNWMVNSLVNKNWEKILSESASSDSLFIGLQVNPESTIDYYVKNIELIDYKKVLMNMVDQFTKQGFKVFLKDHPNMFGMRDYNFIKKLISYENVVFIPYEIPSNFFVEKCSATFTWTGTIGLQSALAGKCPIVVEPTYYLEDYFLKLDSIDSIKDLPSLVRDFRSSIQSSEEGKKLLRHAMNTYLPGTMQPLKFNPDNKDLVEGTLILVETLDQLLPELLKT